MFLCAAAFLQLLSFLSDCRPKLGAEQAMAEAQSACEAEDQRSAFQALARQAEEELASLTAKHEREAERASKRAEWLAEIPSSALEQTPWQYTCGPGSGAGKHGRKEKKEEKRNQKAQEKAQSRSLRMAERRSPNGYEGGDLQSFKELFLTWSIPFGCSWA